MWKSILAISVGAVVGSLLRWQLGTRLNAIFPTIPLGTLVANLIGAYVIGLAIVFFCLVLGARARMASVSDYRFLRGSHHVFNFFCGTDDTAATRAHLLGSWYRRYPCRGIGFDDLCRHCHIRLGEECELMQLLSGSGIGYQNASRVWQAEGENHARIIPEVLRRRKRAPSRRSPLGVAAPPGQQTRHSGRLGVPCNWRFWATSYRTRRPLF